jgi:hypothetical protein
MRNMGSGLGETTSQNREHVVLISVGPLSKIPSYRSIYITFHTYSSLLRLNTDARMHVNLCKKYRLSEKIGLNRGAFPARLPPFI